MNLDTFKTSIEEDSPPGGLRPPLLALWHLGKGDWDSAHKVAQADDSADSAWVHAHLHRVEGDESNAGYWYRRAGKSHGTAPLDTEWDEIVTALL